MSSYKEHFNKLIIENNFNKLPSATEVPPQSTKSFNRSKDLMHELIFECYKQTMPLDMKKYNEDIHWANKGKNKCNTENMVEIPKFLKKNKLPSKSDNSELQFIDQEEKYWNPSNIQSIIDLKNEFNEPNIPIAGWNYLSREDAEFIDCKKQIEALNTQNNLLLKKYDMILKFAIEVMKTLPKTAEQELKDKLAAIELEQKQNEQFILAKQQNNPINDMFLLNKAKTCIQIMAEEITSMRFKYKKNYTTEIDEIIIPEEFILFLSNEGFKKYNFGNKSKDDNYYFPEIKEIYYSDELLVKITTEKDPSYINKITACIDKLISSEILGEDERCVEFMRIFYSMLNLSEIRSKLEYLEYYKESFLHINALTTIKDLQEKNMLKICHEFETKDIKDELQKAYGEYDIFMEDHYKRYSRENIRYSKGYIADLLISSFLKGINYTREFSKKIGDVSPDEFLIRFIDNLSRDKEHTIYISKDSSYSYEHLILRLDRTLLNSKPVVNGNQIYFGYNAEFKNKENILNELQYNLVQQVNTEYKLETNNTLEDCFKSIIDNMNTAHITDFIEKLRKVILKPEIIASIPKTKGSCFNFQILCVFYNISFLAVDMLCYFLEGYISPFEWNDTEPKNIHTFYKRKKQCLEFFKNMNTITLYQSSLNTTEDFYPFICRIILRFCINLYHLLFSDFDDAYFFVIMNSFFTCYIPFIFNDFKYDIANIENYECFFHEGKLKDIGSVSIDKKLCLKGIRIQECSEISDMQNEDIVDVIIEEPGVSYLSLNFDKYSKLNINTLLFALFFKKNNPFINQLKITDPFDQFSPHSEDSCDPLEFKTKLIEYYNCIHSDNYKIFPTADILKFLIDCESPEIAKDFDNMHINDLFDYLIERFKFNYKITVRDNSKDTSKTDLDEYDYEGFPNFIWKVNDLSDYLPITLDKHSNTLHITDTEVLKEGTLLIKNKIIHDADMLVVCVDRGENSDEDDKEDDENDDSDSDDSDSDDYAYDDADDADDADDDDADADDADDADDDAADDKSQHSASIDDEHKVPGTPKLKLLVSPSKTDKKVKLDNKRFLDKKYFDTQGSDLSCGRHALNNLLRGEYFYFDYKGARADITLETLLHETTGKELSDIVFPINLQEVCYVNSPFTKSTDCPSIENYDISTLERALHLVSFGIKKDDKNHMMGAFNNVKTLQQWCGDNSSFYLLINKNLGYHWISARRYSDTPQFVYVYDSLNKEGKQLVEYSFYKFTSSYLTNNFDNDLFFEVIKLDEDFDPLRAEIVRFSQPFKLFQELTLKGNRRVKLIETINDATSPNGIKEISKLYVAETILEKSENKKLFECVDSALQNPSITITSKMLLKDIIKDPKCPKKIGGNDIQIFILGTSQLKDSKIITNFKNSYLGQNSYILVQNLQEITMDDLIGNQSGGKRNNKKIDIQFNIEDTLYLNAIIVPRKCYFKIENSWFSMNNKKLKQININDDNIKNYYSAKCSTLIYFGKDVTFDDLIEKYNNMKSEYNLLTKCYSRSVKKENIRCDDPEIYTDMVYKLNHTLNKGCPIEAEEKFAICSAQREEYLEKLSNTLSFVNQEVEQKNAIKAQISSMIESTLLPKVRNKVDKATIESLSKKYEDLKSNFSKSEEEFSQIKSELEAEVQKFMKLSELKDIEMQDMVFQGVVKDTMTSQMVKNMEKDLKSNIEQLLAELTSLKEKIKLAEANQTVNDLIDASYNLVNEKKHKQEKENLQSQIERLQNEITKMHFKEEAGKAVAKMVRTIVEKTAEIQRSELLAELDISKKLIMEKEDQILKLKEEIKSNEDSQVKGVMSSMLDKLQLNEKESILSQYSKELNELKTKYGSILETIEEFVSLARERNETKVIEYLNKLLENKNQEQAKIKEILDSLLNSLKDRVDKQEFDELLKNLDITNMRLTGLKEFQPENDVKFTQELNKTDQLKRCIISLGETCIRPRNNLQELSAQQALQRFEEGILERRRLSRKRNKREGRQSRKK
jgi:hypothetical protein